jgi:hypothetical protein
MDPIDHNADTSDQLLGYLEFRTGRSLRSRRAIDDYVAALEAGGAGASLSNRSLRLTAGMSVLALMFLFYYFMDVGLQISTLRSNVLTPAAVTAPLPRLELRSRT